MNKNSLGLAGRLLSFQKPNRPAMDPEKIYQGQLEPLLKQEELKRKARWNKVKMQVLLVAVGGGLLGLLIGLALEEGSLVPGIALFMVGGVGGLSWLQRQHQPFLDEIKQNCLQVVFEELVLQAHYYPERGFHRREFKEANFTQYQFPSFNSGDSIEGKWEGLQCCLAQVRYHESGRKTKFYTMGRIELPKDWGFQLFLRFNIPDVKFDRNASKEERAGQMVQKTQSFAAGFLRPPRVRGVDLQRVTHHDEQFRQHFDAFSTDTEAANQLLTEDFKNQLLALKIRGTVLEEHNQGLLKEKRLPNLRQPALTLSLRGQTLYWSRFIKHEWIPVNLQESLLQPHRWESFLLDLDDARQIAGLFAKKE